MPTSDIDLVAEIHLANDGFAKDTKGNITAERKFVVRLVTGSLTSTGTLIDQVFGVLPQRGDPHPRNARVFCRNLDVKARNEDNRTYDATAYYGKEPSPGNTSSTELAPWEETPSVSIGGGAEGIERVQAYAYVAWKNFLRMDYVWSSEDGHLLLTTSGSAPLEVHGSTSADWVVPKWRVANSAGDRMKDSPTEPDTVTTFSIGYARRYSDVPVSTFLNKKNCVNFAAVTVVGVTFPQFCGRIAEVKADLKYWNKIGYWQISIELQFNPAGWLTVLADYGLRERSHSVSAGWSSTLTPITIDGNYVQEPLPLFGEGNFSLLKGQWTSDPADDIVGAFLTKKPIDWSSLLIPSSLVVASASVPVSS